MPAVPHAEALAQLPDEAATLEMRAMALDARSTIFRSAGGMLIVDAERRLAAARGPVSADDVDELFRRWSLECELLADADARQSLHHWRPFERAVLLKLAGPWSGPPAPAGLTIRTLARHDSLEHLPDDLRAELAVQLERGPIVTGLVDGRAAAFAYVPHQTETLADISIDTLAEFRNRGIATAVAAALVERIVANNQIPVWGAIERNRGSLKLAARLGFRQAAGDVFVSAFL